MALLSAKCANTKFLQVKEMIDQKKKDRQEDTIVITDLLVITNESLKTILLEEEVISPGVLVIAIEIKIEAFMVEVDFKKKKGALSVIETKETTEKINPREN